MLYQIQTDENANLITFSVSPLVLLDLFVHVEFLHQSFWLPVVIPVIGQSKSLTVDSPHITRRQVTVHKLLQGFQLIVLRSVVIRENGNTIVQLEGVRVSSIIHQYHIFHISPQNSQILNVHPLWGLITVLSVQSVFNEFVIRVQVIKHHIGVARVRCSEHNHLKVFSQVLEDLFCVRANIDARFDYFSCWELDWQFDVMRRGQTVVAMNQGLIQVKYDALSVYNNEINYFICLSSRACLGTFFLFPHHWVVMTFPRF